MFSERVIEAGVVSRAELEAIDREMTAEIDAALAFAKSSPSPTLADLSTDVYVAY